jgi:hypothetical protein
MGTNRDLMVSESDPHSHTKHMVKYEQKKKIININAFYKVIILKNYSCTPLLPNFTKEDHYFSK